MIVLSDIDWTALAERVGFPVVALVVVGLSIAYVCRAGWRELGVPVRDKIIVRVNGFFDRLDRTLDKMLEQANHDSVALARHEEILWRIENAVEEVQDQCQEIRARQEGRDPPPKRTVRTVRPRPASTPPHPGESSVP